MNLDELLEASDFVTLHVPVLPATRDRVNAEFLKKIKLGAYLINISRGELIEEELLYKALV